MSNRESSHQSGHESDVAPLEAGIMSGGLELRLARTEEEVRALQRLRYRVFYEEMNATPIGTMAAEGRDFDDFDTICDHLIVRDPKREGEASIVGTYRLLRRSVAEQHGRFYTTGEYDIAKLLSVEGELVELGRSCVDPNYRAGGAITALLRGLGTYADRYDIRIMFGCASLHGTDPDDLALPLSYLSYYRAAPDALRPRALDDLYVGMERLPAEAVDEARGWASLPPLIKGYVRAGCRFGDGAVIDRQFNTTDVCVVLDVSTVNDRYSKRYRDLEGGGGGEDGDMAMDGHGGG
ncbi:MAG: GNAT family N-acetyltransferase [Rhodospirillales bacterium]|nr:GNAT family N-acetyltransferase [Rhodospirillales bacterium]